MSINPKHVENFDLLGMNFHTVTKSLMSKLPIEYQNSYFE